MAHLVYLFLFLPFWVPSLTAYVVLHNCII